jgi:ATP-binding cassette subfamily B (MDR/TAP) protein 1
VEAGEKVALVGPSGCGKSTLLQLLQRNYPYEGEILLDGIDIREYDLRSYRSYFGVVNQEPSLFLGSIRSNVICGKEVSEQRLTEVCEQSCAFSRSSKDENSAEKSRTISDFLQKSVGSKGSNISGGEKQRTAIARALLREPRIFILDEGTSALDRETEKIVQMNLDQFFTGCTSINVAHRLETIENCDRIFLMKDGSIL